MSKTETAKANLKVNFGAKDKIDLTQVQDGELIALTKDADNANKAYGTKSDGSVGFIDDITISSSGVVPTGANTDLGSSSNKWKDIHLSNTINIGLNKIEGDPYGALKFGTEYGYLNIFKGSIIPGYNDEYSLGIDSNKFKDGYFSGNVYQATYDGTLTWDNPSSMSSSTIIMNKVHREGKRIDFQLRLVFTTTSAGSIVLAYFPSEIAALFSSTPSKFMIDYRCNAWDGYGAYISRRTSDGALYLSAYVPQQTDRTMSINGTMWL